MVFVQASRPSKTASYTHCGNNLSCAASQTDGQGRSFFSQDGIALKISLSALVPVYNCQTTVASLVSHLLEHLAELTNRFELLVIDNGSTDATAEVIADLAVVYPQTGRLVLPCRSDWASVVRAGLRHSSGEIVLDRSQGCQSGMSALTGLWQAMRLGDVAVVRSQPAMLGSIPPLPLENRAPDWQMVRRCALDGWLRTRSNRDWVSFLAARGYAVQEVDARNTSRDLPSANIGLKLPAAEAIWPAAAVGKRPTRRPNYLDRIKAFALGE